MIENEKSWFAQSMHAGVDSWDGKEIVDEVYMQTNGSGTFEKIHRIVESYFASKGFSRLEEDKLAMPVRFKRDGWRINPLEKTFMRVSKVFENPRKAKKGWPSQISHFMKTRRGAVAGHKFDV